MKYDKWFSILLIVFLSLLIASSLFQNMAPLHQPKFIDVSGTFIAVDHIVKFVARSNTLYIWSDVRCFWESGKRVNYCEFKLPHEEMERVLKILIERES